MKARGAAVQGVLALVGLMAAYAAWQREPETGAEEVVILDLAKADLEQIRFEDGLRWTALERKRKEGEEGLWMHTGQKPPPAALSVDGGSPADGGTASAPEATPMAKADGGTPKPDAGVGSKPDAGVGGKPDAGVGGKPDAGVAPTPPSPTPPEPPKPEREVKTNEQAERLMERFTPLRASRSLGVLSPEKLKELGLENTGRSLALLARGKTYSFTVSSIGNSPYLRNTEDGKVYLVSSALISDLDAASSRLLERRLHAFKQNEPEAVTVQLGDKRRELLQSASEQGVVTRISAKASPDKPDDFAKNWLERVWRLIPTDILGKGELPPGGAPQVTLKLEYLRKDKSLGFTEFARVNGILYVRTEFTASWVKVHAPPDEILVEATRVASGT